MTDPTTAATKAALVAEIERLRRRLAELESRGEIGAERELALAEQLRALLTHTTDYVYFKNESRRYVLASNTFCELFQLPIEEIIGKRDEDLFPPEVAALGKRDDLQVLDTGQPIMDREETDGHGDWYQTTKVPWCDDAGRIVGLVGITRNISDRKRKEAERAALLEQLHHAQKMDSLGQIAGGVAHDINNMLTAVVGTISLMEDDPDDPSLRKQRLDNIQQACMRGHDLTRNLLGFARKGRYEPTHVAVGDLIESTQSLLSKTIGKGIEIITRCPSDVSPIIADAGQISHVLLNLCLNGADAMSGRGTLTLTAQNVRVEDAPGAHAEASPVPAGAYVRLTVSDTGVGMDDETRKRAFEPFFTTKTLGEGTGLGLSMVYGAISSHGGHVELESEHGVGTIVSILLPAAVTEDSAVPVSSRQSAPSRAGRVLLVDDEETVLSLGKEMLERLGYDVVAVSDGLAAVELYEAKGSEIDLVILDLSMPVMDGAEAFERLQALDPDVTVLICSGHFAEERVETIMKCGAVGYLQKPYRMQDLNTQLDRAIRSRRTESTSSHDSDAGRSAAAEAVSK